MRRRLTRLALGVLAGTVLATLAACETAVKTIEPIQRRFNTGADLSTPVTGRASVVDGRTVIVDDQRIQLYGIDAPDPDQTCLNAAGKDYPCGLDARDALVKLIAADSVTCRPRGASLSNVTLAVCAVGRTDLAQSQIDAGWAIADRPHTLYYEDSELAARTRKVGIWQGRFVPPQEWRNGERVAPNRALKGTLPGGE